MSTPETLPSQPQAETLSEAEFLQRETEQSKAAIEQSIADLKQSLHTAADLKLWAEHHPWLTVGGAAAGGFAIGAAIVSVLSGNPPPQPSANGQPAVAAPDVPRQGTLASALLGPLFELAKIAVQSSIASAMEGAKQAEIREQAYPETRNTKEANKPASC